MTGFFIQYVHKWTNKKVTISNVAVLWRTTLDTSFARHCSSAQPQVAKFIVPDWGLWLTPAKGCRTYPPAYVARRAGTRNLCRSQLYPPGQGLWIWLHGADPHPLLPLSAVKAGRNQKSFERVEYPLLQTLLTGIGERYNQTIANLCQAALLRRCELSV